MASKYLLGKPEDYDFFILEMKDDVLWKGMSVGFYPAYSFKEGAKKGKKRLFSNMLCFHTIEEAQSFLDTEVSQMCLPPSRVFHPYTPKVKNASSDE